MILLTENFLVFGMYAYMHVCMFFFWVDLDAQTMMGLLKMLGVQRPSPFWMNLNLKNKTKQFLDQFSHKSKHLKDSNNNFLGRKDGRCSELGSAADTECGLAPSLGIVLGCYVPLKALVPFQKLSKSGTDLLAATAEGSYWSIPNSQEVTGKREESKTSNQILVHLINLSWKFCLKAVKE